MSIALAKMALRGITLYATTCALCTPAVAARTVHRARLLKAAYKLESQRFFLPNMRCEGPSRECFMVRATSASFVEQINQKNSENKVVLYSKSYCPYCRQVKGLFGKLGVDYKLIELDEIEDGAEVQEALEEISHRRTVPQVFIGGEFVGGADDTLGMYQSGELKGVMQKSGVAATFDS